MSLCMLLAVDLPSIPSAPSTDTIGSKELIVLMVMLSVMLVQLVNNVVNSRHNVAVQQKVQDLKESVNLTVQSGLHGIDDSFRKLQDTMSRAVLVVEKLDNTISGMTVMSDSLRKTSEITEAIHKIVDARDEESRRRIYTPNKSDEIQREILNLINQMNKTQCTVTANLHDVVVAIHDVIMMISGASASTIVTDTTKIQMPHKMGMNK